jgi:hypothetical protein
MRLILEEDVESMSGDEDFFSVARTMPLVADVDEHLGGCDGGSKPTLNSQRCNTLVDSVQSVF